MEEDTSKSKRRKLKETEDSEESPADQVSVIICTYPKCGKKFQSQAQLIRHIKTTGHDLSNLKLKCPVYQCSRAFGGTSSNQDLINHMKNDHSREERGKLECKKCFKIFCSIPPLKVHVTSKTCQAKKAPNSGSGVGSTQKIDSSKKSNVVKRKNSCREENNVVKKKNRSVILNKSAKSPNTSSGKNSSNKPKAQVISKPSQSVPQAPQPKMNPETTNPQIRALKTGLPILPPGINSSRVAASPASAFDSVLLGMYRCTKCTKIWETLSALQNHFSTEHRNESKTALEDLGKQLILVKVVTLKKAESKTVFKCSKCVESFLQNQSLITHMRGHPPNGHGGFPCTKCPGAFTTKQRLNEHLNQGHNQNILPNQQKQNGGSTSVNNFNGEGSNEDFWSGIEIIPDNTNVGPDTESGENAEINLTCDNPECFDKSFATKDELEYHRLSHIVKNESAFDEDGNSTTVIDFKSQKIVKCHICFLEFRGPGLLLSHIALYHSSNLQPTFQCTQCDKKFLATDVLRYHQIEHTSYWKYLDGEQRQKLETMMFTINKSKQAFKCVHENCKKLAPYLIFQEFLKHVESSHSIVDESEEEEKEEVINIKYEFEPEEAEIYGNFNTEY